MKKAAGARKSSTPPAKKYPTRLGVKTPVNNGRGGGVSSTGAAAMRAPKKGTHMACPSCGVAIHLSVSDDEDEESKGGEESEDNGDENGDTETDDAEEQEEQEGPPRSLVSIKRPIDLPKHAFSTPFTNADFGGMVCVKFSAFELPTDVQPGYYLGEVLYLVSGPDAAKDV